MKRFTETDKWTDNFFADLLPVEKLAWLYILDNCDAAGVIEVPGKVANFLIGENIDWEAFMLTLADLGKLQQIENRKFWVTNFLRVQHRGGISATAPKHAYVRQSISRYNLPVSIQDSVQSTNSVPTKKQPSTNRVPTEYVPSTYKDKDKDKDKDKGIVKGKRLCSLTTGNPRTQSTPPNMDSTHKVPSSSSKTGRPAEVKSTPTGSRHFSTLVATGSKTTRSPR